MPRVNYYHPLTENTCYHIYNRSVGDTDIFLEDACCERFLSRYRGLLGQYVNTYAYTLMSNHFHLIVQCKPVNELLLEHAAMEGTTKGLAFTRGELSYNDFLADQFKRLFNGFSTYFNKQNDRHGSLLQRKFKRIRARNVDHLRYLLWYTHHNCVHHRVQRDYADHKHSSYHDYSAEHSDWLKIKPILRLFEGGKAGFLKFHEANKNCKGTLGMAAHPDAGTIDGMDLFSL